MLSSLRVTSRFLQSSLRPSAPRAFSTSLRAQREAGASGSAQRESSQDDESGMTTYKEFMEKIGSQYETAQRPNNWLHPERPFPMNDSFLPPPPVSDALRQRIWDKFMQNPRKNNLRALSEKYGLSLKRVDAILRLKGLEWSWLEKGTTLQTGFRIGMERILGVPQSSQADRHDAFQADMLEQDENRDAARQRYQRSYWESVPIEGREPVTPTSLENAKQTARRFSNLIEEKKSGPNLMPRIPNTRSIMKPKKTIQQVTKEGRPTLEFLDVGGKFVDVNERLRRIAVARRRARVKTAKKAGEKTGSAL